MGKPIVCVMPATACLRLSALQSKWAEQVPWQHTSLPARWTKSLFGTGLCRFGKFRPYTSTVLLGLGSGRTWTVITSTNKLPGRAVTAAQICVLVLSIIWVSILARHLSELSDVSPVSTSLPYAVMVTMVLIVVADTYIYRGRYFWPGLVTLAVMSLAVVSNQVFVASVLEKGQRDAEFRQLVDWYRANAKPWEKLVCSMVDSMGMLAPKYKDMFIGPGILDARSPEDFVNRCYAESITYVAWDSRMGLSPHSVFYKLSRYDNISALGEPRSVGMYEYITTFFHATQAWRYINLFRLRPPTAPDGNSVSRLLP